MLLLSNSVFDKEVPVQSSHQFSFTERPFVALPFTPVPFTEWDGVAQLLIH
jgi:hypothetical protein